MRQLEQEFRMDYSSDSFKVNWSERIIQNGIGKIITSITGYQYQVDSWKCDYLKEFKSEEYLTRTITKLINDDQTITLTVSRLEVPRRT